MISAIAAGTSTQTKMDPDPDPQTPLTHLSPQRLCRCPIAPMHDQDFWTHQTTWWILWTCLILCERKSHKVFGMKDVLSWWNQYNTSSSMRIQWLELLELNQAHSLHFLCDVGCVPHTTKLRCTVVCFCASNGICANPASMFVVPSHGLDLWHGSHKKQLCGG